MIWFLMQRSKKYYAILSTRRPDARADIKGSGEYPELTGIVRFYQTPEGVLVSTEVVGLPRGGGPCKSGIFAYHIHEGGRCAGPPGDPFADAKGHFNPGGCSHPFHAGDMPPLFEVDGRAFSVFLTGRFRAADIVGRTVIIHAGRDDFTSQPSGNPGKMIACGVIRA